jgi:transcriptional regulator GlxA family with amidase domain
LIAWFMVSLERLQGDGTENRALPSEMRMTKSSDKSAPGFSPVEIGLVCDGGTVRAGIYGLTDLFSYAGDIAAAHTSAKTTPVRLTHWQATESRDIGCIHDSAPGSPNAPAVLLIPGNTVAPAKDLSDSPLVPWLQQKHSQGTVLAAVCGGVFLLARTGLLAGRQATTHWALTDQFVAQFPDIRTQTDSMVIDYGDVLTGGGVLAWADVGLRLVERFLGPSIMVETARYMNVDPPGREQRFYSGFEPRTKHGDEQILKVQQWLAAHESAVTVADAARRAGLEPRTFLRRFIQATGMRPSEYQQRLRISRAREMLEFSRKSVDNIALNVGYEDVGGFRRVFRKIVGLTPSDYRRRFSRVSKAG